MFKDEKNYRVAVWALLGTVVIALATLGVYANHIEDQKVVELVSKGADPIVAKCSLDFQTQGAAPLICVEAFKNANK